MTRVVIPKNRIVEILTYMMKCFRLVAPVMDGQNLVFKQVDRVEDAVLNDELPLRSPKEFLFPQVEQTMIFGKDGRVRVNDDVSKTILFGIRPCDLDALKVMTAVFTQGRYKDNYFAKKLENTILIGIGCLNEKKGCFCTERGLKKDFSSSCDVFLNDEGDVYLAEVMTDKGKDLLEIYSFRVMEKMDIECNPTDKNDILEINSDELTLFNKIDWARISEKCLGCGTCTYICPTCHCFDFKDVVEKGEAVRYKCWDSCMFPKFTVHASGHNPRASKKERYRQRIMHKYHYIKENFGYVACTGCGRCIRSCPAGMNIKAVVEDIVSELYLIGINKTGNG